MKGIILAAGRGSRMGGLTSDQPKCMTELNGKPLVEWQLAAIRSCGVDDVAIVRGYKKELFSFDLSYFDNDIWENSNMVTSLITASSWLESDECMVSYSDIVFSAETARALAACGGDIAISYDKSWADLWKRRFDDPLSDAESFRLGEDGQLLEIGSRVETMDEIQGQFMGLLKFSPAGWQSVMQYLGELPTEDVNKLDVTALLSALLKRGVKIEAVPCVGRWYEVDSRSDLSLYETMIKNNGDMWSFPDEGENGYQYAGRDLFAEPETYSYAKCDSAGYLDRWRRARRDSAMRFERALAAGVAGRSCVDEPELDGRLFRLRDIMKDVSAQLTGNIIGPDEAERRIGPFIKKYEIFKRLFSHYGPDNLRAERSIPAAMDTYVEMCACLCEIIDGNSSLKALSALLKLCDALASQDPALFSSEGAARFLKIMKREDRYIAALKDSL